MRPHLALTLLLAAGCGALPSADPCAVDAAGLTLGANAASVTESRLECNAEGGSSACGADVAIAHAACGSDGYGFALSSGATTILVRLRSDGAKWTGGAQVAGGETLTGSFELAGMGDPANPVPAAGRQQKASFFLSGSSGTYNGTFLTTW